MRPPVELDPDLLLASFAVGPRNRLAAAAATRVAESPGGSYNPLVVHGPEGAGKTHLLHAVGHHARSVVPGLAVRYETGAGLVQRVTECLAAGTVAELRAAMAGVSLWLLDDLEELAGKPRTQRELLVLLEGLVGRGGQLVAAAERAPDEIEGLDPELAARLASGLAIEMGVPDPEPASPDPSGSPDEFGAFMADISTAVAAVVETAPWRRRHAAAILEWEGEGMRTRRLEEALDADSAPDVDALLSAFARDAWRLREIAGLLPTPPADPTLLADPDRLAEAEALLATGRATRPPPEADPASPARRPAPIDAWFLEPSRVDLGWVSVEERVAEEPR